MVPDLGDAHLTGRHQGRGPPRADRFRRPVGGRAVVDDGVARPRRIARPRDDARRAPLSRHRTDQPARIEHSPHRRADRTPLRGGIRRLVGAPFRHRGGARRGIRLRIRPRPVHDGDLHAPHARHTRRRRSRQGIPGGGAIRIAHPIGLRPDGECLWHRPTFVRIRGGRRTAPPPSPTEGWNYGHDEGRDRRLPAPDGLQLFRRPAPRAAV